MDPVGLSILIAEIEADCTVIHDAAIKAAARLGDDGEGRLEACAYELARLYNVLDLTSQIPVWSAAFGAQVRLEQVWN